MHSFTLICLEKYSQEVAHAVVTAPQRVTLTRSAFYLKKYLKMDIADFSMVTVYLDFCMLFPCPSGFTPGSAVYPTV